MSENVFEGSELAGRNFGEGILRVRVEQIPAVALFLAISCLGHSYSHTWEVSLAP